MAFGVASTPSLPAGMRTFATATRGGCPPLVRHVIFLDARHGDETCGHASTVARELSHHTPDETAWRERPLFVLRDRTEDEIQLWANRLRLDRSPHLRPFA
jgi:hypothetical protein